jgi:hypothetical protein
VTFTKRVTVKNTRQTALRLLTVKGQVPVSEDDVIKITVLEPSALSARGTLKESVLPKAGVSARWAQKNEDGTGGDADNGFLEWIYDGVEAGASVVSTLSYEISAPAGVKW